MHVPFARALVDELVYQGMDPRIQRDTQRILALIKSVAVLRHHDRERDEAGRLVATVDDYTTVREILNESYTATANAGLAAAVRAVVGAVSELKEFGQTPATYVQIAAKLGWHDTRVRRHAAAGMKHGYLVNRQEKRRQAAMLDTGEVMPEARCLPEANAIEKACVTPSQNGQRRSDASNHAGSRAATHSDANSDGVATDNDGSDVANSVATENANKNNASLRRYEIREGMAHTFSSGNAGFTPEEILRQYHEAAIIKGAEDE